MNVYTVTVLILLVYLALAWMGGALLHLNGARLWLFRGGLMLIGAAAAGLFLWFHYRLRRRNTLTPAAFAGVAGQIKFLLRQAEQKLIMGKQGNLGSLPIVFVLGEANSAKTSSIVHSGLEPELIAGHVFDQEGKIVPTGTINVWFARKTVFIEAGGKMSADPQLWAQVLRQTSPKRISAAVGKGEQASRAVLVCVDCDHLSAAQPSIQNLANRLKETARSLGAPFPVYVLFTKMDLVRPAGDMKPFEQYVSNLTSEESAQILGATLPRVPAHGVFEQEENKRLTLAFDQIVYSLAEKRLDLLSRETQAERISGTYEFPREIRKRRDQIVQLLVELTRPTQLSANPFLRGFYFSGVRPVIVNEAVSVAAPARRVAAQGAGAGATRMFNYAEEARAVAQEVPLPSVQTRRKPEWTFLSRLFADVILADRLAFSASHQSSRVDRLRRGLLAFAGLFLLFFAIMLVISFARNNILENQVEQAARHLNAISPGAANEAPSLEQLRTLDELRGSVEQLGQFQIEGAPLSYRFGLYAGDRIYSPAYGLYFQNFRRFLLAPAQNRMLAAVLKQTPATKTSDDFQTMYSTLKAYLITTSNHEHANWNSLVSVLLDNSPAFKNPDPEYQNLVRRQFSFYAGLLPGASPYGPENDSAAVDNARAYLRQFDAVEAIYQAMLDDAAKGNKPVNFSRLFPQATPFVVDNYEVPAAFTKDGYSVMQKSLENPERFQGEEWVLGTTPRVTQAAGILRQTLTSRYYADYARHWRAYLRSARVIGYGNLRDAVTKLSKLIANDSPLLQLFWLAKENTAVAIPDLKDPFESVQMIARDSTLERLVGSGSQEYMGALSGLQNSVQTVANIPGNPDPATLAPAQQAVSAANGTAKRIEQRFPIDTQGGADGVDKNVSRLLEQPIDFANKAIGGSAQGGAASVCKIVNEVVGKRPFNQHASQQAALQEVQDMFRPQGTLWTSVQARLGSSVQRQGANWVSVGSVPQSQTFLGFLSRAQQFTDTLFPNSSPTIHLGYTLRRLPTSGIDQASLFIDGQSLTDVGRAQQFVWQGRDSSVSLSVTAAGQKFNPDPGQGPWALFDFFNGADTWTGNNPAVLAWQLRLQFGRQASEQKKSEVQYELTTQGAQVFRKEFLSGLHCSVH